MTNKKKEIYLRELLEAGAHFGHQAARWNPKMKDYLYDIRDGIHIFDLAKTRDGLVAAIEFVQKLTSEGKTIVFLGTKRQAKNIISEEAQRAGVPYISERWLGGTLTNWEQIKRGIDRLRSMREKREKGEYKGFTKMEQLLLDREITKLETMYGGVASLTAVPDALFVVDIRKEELAIKEAIRTGIKIVAIVDSNSDPDLVDYVIPCNDDAVGTIKMVVTAIADAAKEGLEALAKKRAAESRKTEVKTAKKAKKANNEQS